MDQLELAARLIDARRAADLTQEEAAEAAGVSPSTLSGLESAKVRRPQFRTLRKLAGAYGIEVAELYKEPAFPKVDAPPSPRLWPAEERRIPEERRERRSKYNSEEEEVLHREHNWRLILSGALDRARSVEQASRGADRSTVSVGGNITDEIAALMSEYRVAGGAQGSEELEKLNAQIWQVLGNIGRMREQKISAPLTPEQERHVGRFNRSNQAGRISPPDTAEEEENG